MADVISPSQLSVEVGRVLEQFRATTEIALSEAVNEATEEIVKDLRATSPKRSGKYAEGWTRTPKNVKKRQAGYARIVYNPKHYRLTHLLEYGHAMPDGGRSEAQPHIAPAEERGIDNFERKLLEKLT